MRIEKRENLRFSRPRLDYKLSENKQGHNVLRVRINSEKTYSPLRPLLIGKIKSIPLKDPKVKYIFQCAVTLKTKQRISKHLP